MSLKDYYDEVYRGNKNQHFLKYRQGATASETHQLAAKWLAEHAPECRALLDFGCGEADFLGHFVPPSVRRVGVDYSEAALANAKARYTGIELVVGDDTCLTGHAAAFDVVTSFGTIEHLDDPKQAMKSLAACLRPGGLLLVSCPNFINVRGVIWMTLSKLFDVPMSLSDRHFIGPADIEAWSKELGLEVIAMQAVDLDVGQGDYLCVDMKRRLTNALRDAKLDNSKVDDLLAWVTANLPYFPAGSLSGSECLYLVRR